MTAQMFHPLAFLLLIFSSHAFAQTQSLRTIKGVIIADSIAQREVNIVNLNTKKGVVSQADGQFTIEAKTNDTLVFSSLQYEPYSLLVKEASFEKTLKVYLFPLINELEQVEVSNISLEGILQTDVNQLELKPIFRNEDLGFPTIKRPSLAERRLYTAMSSGSGLPLDPLLNMISGRLKVLKRQVAYEKLEQKVSEVFSLFSQYYFINDLEIPEYFVEDFIYYCLEFSNFEEMLGHKDKLQMLEFFKSIKTTYLKRKEITE